MNLSRFSYEIYDALFLLRCCFHVLIINLLICVPMIVSPVMLSLDVYEYIMTLALIRYSFETLSKDNKSSVFSKRWRPAHCPPGASTPLSASASDTSAMLPRVKCSASLITCRGTMSLSSAFDWRYSSGFGNVKRAFCTDPSSKSSLCIRLRSVVLDLFGPSVTMGMVGSISFGAVTSGTLSIASTQCSIFSVTSFTRVANCVFVGRPDFLANPNTAGDE